MQLESVQGRRRSSFSDFTVFFRHGDRTGLEKRVADDVGVPFSGA
jgi:hypothetical protein